LLRDLRKPPLAAKSPYRPQDRRRIEQHAYQYYSDADGQHDSRFREIQVRARNAFNERHRVIL
jgi:hypothetical protein